MEHVQYSIIIPIYNEKEVLPTLYSRLTTVLNSLDDNYEIIFVNDGSKDNSLTIMKEFSSKDKRLKIVDLSRNFGHQKAISAGLKFANGRAVIIMDGDLQDPPETLPYLIKKWKEGYEVVYAVRKERKEKIWKKLSYKLFYKILNVISDENIPLDTGDFCIMDKKVVDLLNSMPERNRFIRGLRNWVGFKQISFEYKRESRFDGKPKYTFSKLLKLALDGIFSFSSMPLRFVSLSGLFVSLISILGIMFVLYRRLTHHTVPGTALIIILILFIGGLQLVAIGIGFEYIGRIYDEVKHRPLYIVKQLIGFEKDRN